MTEDLYLWPGELGALLAARGLSPRPGTLEQSFGLLDPPSEFDPPPLESAAAPSRDQVQGLDHALSTLARPARIATGRRGARRMEPWAFALFQGEDQATVLLAPEGGGHGRLRFAFSQAETMDWLAGPFRRFAAPEIGTPELPPMTPAGLSVLLAIVDLFRHRYPELDPDWAETEPIVFGLPEVMACLAASLGGNDPTAVWSGLAGLGLARPAPLPDEEVLSLLYVFANEGYLELDLSHDEPMFAITETFLGVPLSLAWWDLSLMLEVAQGGRPDTVRVLQGLALWRFDLLSDDCLEMKAVSGQELESSLRVLLYGDARESPAPTRTPAVPAPPAPPAPHPVEISCPHCGHQISSHAKFCGGCGNRVPHDHCHQCGHKLLEVGAKFCPECGVKQ